MSTLTLLQGDPIADIARLFKTDTVEWKRGVSLTGWQREAPLQLPERPLSRPPHLSLHGCVTPCVPAS